MKKRITSIILSVFLITVLVSCQNNNDESDVASKTSTIGNTASKMEEPDKASMNKLITKMPVIDGSISTIPLNAGIRSALLGISIEEAKKQVLHDRTYGSYKDLLLGDCDVILTVLLSQNQYDDAAQEGVKLEKTPIAMEGFVFVINADNPVEALTQQQIKDIYSGKITNWKDVGGNDAKIVAYQRNSDSNSQDYMNVFMESSKLMKPLTKTIPSELYTLMDVVAAYDNSVNAIGYLVYSYAAEMYIEAGNMKFIKVDGIAPSVKNVTNGSYPLMSYNYAVINANTPKDSPVRTLIKWILSEKGQQAIADSNNFPLVNIKDPLEAKIVMPSNN